MKATIVSYRRGRHTQRQSHILLEVHGCDSKGLVSKFIGRRVLWKTSAGRPIYGKIMAPHGNSGVLRARFSKGLPGYSISQKAEIME
ncbi:MAG: 50S ribosomal protein L35ae [Candidatus Aenigmarchaeota archaeon]|nr:50S ribosomal protein L35ae [Candidatus Aenigmarchaeota archaeon]